MGSEGFAERNRREVLAGVAATALLPAAPVRAATVDDAIAEMIRRGEARDAALRRAFPFGKPDGTSPYLLSQRHGAWLDLKAPDAEEKLDAETGRLRADAARGILPPALILDAVIQAQRALPGPDALRRQLAALETLRRGASDVPGVWRLPGGRFYYAARLQCATGTNWTPGQLEAQLNSAIRRLLARADRLLKPLGLAGGSVGERLRALKSRAAHLYTDDESGPPPAPAR